MELTDESNLSDLLLNRLKATPDGLAYRQYDGRAWVDRRWADVGHEVGRWQAALLKEGLKPGDRVALCLHNRTEWVLFDQAALGLGLVVVPLYFDDRPDNMAWCMNDADVQLLLLEDTAQWKGLRGHATTLKRVVSLSGVIGKDDKPIGLNDWLPAAGEAPRRSPAKADDLATIVYTSGTTGRPKGVMLSHRNILSNVAAALKAYPITPEDRFVSFLPLSHMFERTVGYYSSLCAGAQTVYARGITELGEDINSQRPTILICVPRIFERIYAKMQAGLPPGSLKAKLFNAAVEIGWRRFNRQASFTDKLLWPVLKLLVADKLKRRLGGRIWLIVVGGAALAPSLSRVFIGLGLPIIQGYGLTETSPILSANRLHDNDPLSVGRPFEGIELHTSKDGELLARGPNIMLGYWNNPEATASVIDDEGWFHTGDIVKIRNGRVYITGRVKEIIVMSNGEKVPPGDAEQAILMDPVFEQVMVLGEGRGKLGLLAVSAIKDERELCKRANRQLRDFPGYCKIAHIARVDGPWTVENGLLTPTMKLKRKEVEKRYADEIEAMYTRTDFCL